MLDNIVGRPSLSWRRKESYAVLLFSLYCLFASSKRGPRFLWIRPFNRTLKRFAPWQIITATLSVLYALRNLDKLFGLDVTDLSNSQIYSTEYNFATWIVMALDAGFASAFSIRPKWLRDICSIVFSLYYVFHGDKAESKLLRLRELSTLEFLRGTWNKTHNIYLRAISAPFRQAVQIRRQLCLKRPKALEYDRPITAWLFFAGSEAELSQATELILDFPGGGFVAMDPTDHEDRLRAWTRNTGRPVLSVDYGKAPEFPYPFAIEEGFDLYCTLSETSGRVIGMSGTKFNVILSGDSAGGNIAVNVMFKILEAASPDSPFHTLSLPRPIGIALSYAALNFSFGSWAWPSRPTPAPSSVALDESGKLKNIKSSGALLSTSTILPPSAKVVIGSLQGEKRQQGVGLETIPELPYAQELSPSKTVVHQQAHTSLFEQRQAVISALGPEAFQSPLERAEVSKLARTRLTMSSKAGYMHDRIITPSMMWAMCLLYLGKHPPPGVERDYRLSPLLAPSSLLAELPPILLQCGARDPLIDDTVLFGGRVRAAKREHARLQRANSQTSDLPTPPCDGMHPGDLPEDDVTVQIFPGWSHGYLQMGVLLPKAKVAIDDIAIWINSTFERAQETAVKV
ncbi:hypothetical protein ACEPAI_7951 [Sanghuangporus weigelae]